MYLFAKFGSHRFYWNGDINFYISSDMKTSEETKLNASIRHIENLLNSEIPIYNSTALDIPGRETARSW